MKKIIDCHTHLQTKQLIEEYYKDCKGFAIVMKALDSLIGNGDDIYEEISHFDNIFLCECVDAFSKTSIEDQLKTIEQHLQQYKIVGIKIYLGYQPIFADDKKLFTVYDFAEKHNLSIVFHCGMLVETLQKKTKFNYSSCLPIAKIAKKYPKVNFIVSHFDYPNLQDCLKVITENKNVFTDISGQYENYDNKPYEDLKNLYLEELTCALKNFNKQDILSKVMFGTDYFGKGSGFDEVETYVSTLDAMFGKKNKKLYLYENCLHAYPKIKEYINKK